MVAKNSYFRNAEQPQNKVFIAIFFVVVLLIIGFLAVQNVQMFQKRSELSKTAAELSAKIQELEQQNTTVEASIQTDKGTEYQEKVLREQGLYKKTGEQVITVLPPSKTQQVQQPAKKPWLAPLENLYNSIIGK